MLKNNSIVVGLLGGAVLPGISLFIFLYLLKGSFLILNKPGIPYLIAIALNLFIIRYCFKAGKDNIGAGMILTTFVFAAAVFLLKLQPIR
ncbi:hypothetical protein [Mucilaginibacter ginsenosidivorax]|uniref:Stationary phase survival protein SurE n=1 Tax=Mucilaginibacter ginsenosidivorax TaxID=862126 RepID=A0A5B8W1X4_9SPHI|nr:hypothetical protein [Mucilaginibacter ginsenosidivorax]QEC77723.1 hypothetical protein FSB76_17900 [Mucilaginibacter ginsenosidivorax]